MRGAISNDRPYRDSHSFWFELLYPLFNCNVRAGFALIAQFGGIHASCKRSQRIERPKVSVRAFGYTHYLTERRRATKRAGSTPPFAKLIHRSDFRNPCIHRNLLGAVNNRDPSVRLSAKAWMSVSPERRK